MLRLKDFSEPITVVKYLIRWTLLVTPVALIVGSIVALFLWLLELVTQHRFENEWLLFFLPLAGVLIYYQYELWGKTASHGTNLILDEIHKPGGGVPVAMMPLVLITTVLTHLFGGSAGREGTAVQMGGSIAGLIGKVMGLTKEDLSILLMTGMAAGFGAVFGTPLTGAIFALEVLAIGRIKYNALIPCLIASVFADATCSAWGISHTQYKVDFLLSATSLFPYLRTDLLVLIKVIIAGIAFGLASHLFVTISHAIQLQGKKYIKIRWLIPVVGGVVIIALTFISGTTDYLGLGVVSKDDSGVSIVSAFKNEGVEPFSWLWKIVFTAFTLGLGFKGGEVTPLFFIGATLGNTLAVILGVPVDFLAALGFIAVFAGATNTPIACTIMGVELFGGENVLYYAIACFTAYYFSGHSGIYKSQRISVRKTEG